MLSVLSVGKF